MYVLNVSAAVASLASVFKPIILKNYFGERTLQTLLYVSYTQTINYRCLSSNNDFHFARCVIWLSQYQH